jgi:hypothetical protein
LALCLPLAARHVLLAAGIGVTPFMAMIAALERGGADFHLHMAARDAARLPFRDEIAALVAGRRATLYLSGGEADRRMQGTKIVAGEGARAATHLYACGPAAFIDDFLAAGTALPPERMHVERFSAPAAATASGSVPFEIELAQWPDLDGSARSDHPRRRPGSGHRGGGFLRGRHLRCVPHAHPCRRARSPRLHSGAEGARRKHDDLRRRRQERAAGARSVDPFAYCSSDGPKTSMTDPTLVRAHSRPDAGSAAPAIRAANAA